MRKVVSKSQVAHLWANQSQDQASNAGRSFYFRGGVIFSYGEHFPIASHITGASGRPGVIITRASYSVTNSAHVSIVCDALRGLSLPVFQIQSVPFRAVDKAGLVALAKREAEAFKTGLTANLLRAGRCRAGNKESRLASIAANAERVNSFCAFAGYRGRVSVPTDFEAAIQAAKIADAKQSKKAAAEAKIRAARAAEALRVAVADWHAKADEWKAGRLSVLPYYPAREGVSTFLRLTADGETVQTSRGADVPAVDARRVLALALRCRSRGTEWRPEGLNGCAVGSFALAEVTANGDVRAGCHFIEWAEVERFAVSVGWCAPGCSLQCEPPCPGCLSS